MQKFEFNIDEISFSLTSCQDDFFIVQDGRDQDMKVEKREKCNQI